jgi:hypothetical protein
LGSFRHLLSGLLLLLPLPHLPLVLFDPLLVHSYLGHQAVADLQAILHQQFDVLLVFL